jgi:hypothetical protein
LLREIRKGKRQPGQTVGIPSEYEATGIALLLKPEFERGAAREPLHRPDESDNCQKVAS